MRLNNNICIIGLGYVGLTLAVILADKGFNVFGVEKDKDKLSFLKSGQSHFYEKGLVELLGKHKEKNLHLFEKIPADKKIDIFIIAVCTPIDKITKMPKMDYIKRAVNEILPHLKDEQLVILRSTVSVGTTRQVVLPVLTQKLQNIHLSFCPERTAEGMALIELKSLPQIIGALDKESMHRSIELFSRITPTIVKVSSLEVAEMIKLVDNSYRDSRFAYANQIALICKDLCLDADEVIKAANLDYSRNNIPCPGFVGGTCLEKDPHILINSCSLDCNLIKNARRINESLVFNVLRFVKKYLENNEKSPDEVNVFISGFAFKGEPETNDLRASSTIELLDLLRELQIKNIYGHDFVVKQEEIRKLGVNPCPIGQGFNNADIVVFMNNHRSYKNLNIEKLIKKGLFIFDGWQLFANQLKNNKNIVYETIGFKK